MRAKGTARITWVAMEADQYAAQTGKGEIKSPRCRRGF